MTTGSTGQQVGVFSFDYSGILVSGAGVGAFGYLEGDGSTINDAFGVLGLGLYTDLQSSLSGSGDQIASTGFNTNVGLCEVTSYSDEGATFTISGGSSSAVPEIDPDSLGSVLAIVLGSLGLLERRRLFPCKPEALARGIRVAFP